jgi:hypothetical protein
MSRFLCVQLAQDRSEILQERIKNKTESDERKQEKKNELLKNITEIGIWQNINEITSELALLKTKKEKYFGLKKQINIHKETVTLHNEDKHLLQFIFQHFILFFLFSFITFHFVFNSFLQYFRSVLR